MPVYGLAAFSGLDKDSWIFFIIEVDSHVKGFLGKHKTGNSGKS